MLSKLFEFNENLNITKTLHIVMTLNQAWIQADNCEGFTPRSLGAVGHQRGPWAEPLVGVRGQIIEF